MAKMVVCVFSERRIANAARQRLFEQGFNDAEIRVEGRDGKGRGRAGEGTDDPRAWSRAKESGFAGVVERMFSGLLIDNDAAQYAEAAKRGQTIVALRVPDDATAARAAAILDEVGGITQPSASEASDAPRTPHEGASTERRNPGPLASLSGPRIYPLPNSPTGWGEATRGEKGAVGERMNDPARPEGLVRDAKGLDTDATERAFAARKAAMQSDRQGGKSSRKPGAR